MKVEIIFFKDSHPVLCLTEENGERRELDISDLECFLIRHCLCKPCEAHDWHSLLNGFKMLEDACAVFGCYIKHGCVRDGFRVIYLPIRENTDNEILFRRNRF